MNRIYSTWPEAVKREVIDPITSGGVIENPYAAYDIEAIAKSVIIRENNGYQKANAVTATHFWRVVQANERKGCIAELSEINEERFIDPDDASSGIEYWDTITVWLNGFAEGRITLRSSDNPKKYDDALKAHGYHDVTWLDSIF